MHKEFAKSWEDAFREGYRAGQLAMRERAAKAIDGVPDSGIYRAASLIRALEPEEPT